MKIVVERSLFFEVVSRLQKVVGNKTSMPVLEGILISAEQGKLTLISYNLEMGMKKEILNLKKYLVNVVRIFRLMKHYCFINQLKKKSMMQKKE